MCTHDISGQKANNCHMTQRQYMLHLKKYYDKFFEMTLHSHQNITPSHVDYLHLDLINFTVAISRKFICGTWCSDDFKGDPGP